MLPEIRALVIEALHLTTGEVNELRAALLAEQATEDARYAATTALEHPEGSTTPANEAYSRAQSRFAKLREKAVKDLPKTLAALIAMDVAFQRREEALTHLRMKQDRKVEDDDAGVRQEVRDWFARLSKHGVRPHYLKQHSNETIAILADLVTWKAKDATFKDANNPWRAILTIYADRVIVKPGDTGKAERSMPGVPQQARYEGCRGHYMFSTMVQPEWSAITPVTAAAAAPQPSEPKPPRPVRQSAVDDGASRAAPLKEGNVAAVDISGVTDLLQEIWLCGRNPSVDAVIERLTWYAAPSPQGDYAVFIETARRSGISAGIDAYRQAFGSQDKRWPVVLP